MTKPEKKFRTVEYWDCGKSHYHKTEEAAQKCIEKPERKLKFPDQAKNLQNDAVISSRELATFYGTNRKRINEAKKSGRLPKPDRTVVLSKNKAHMDAWSIGLLREFLNA